jgi:hypothetical protein
MWPGSESSYHPPDHVVNYNGTMRPIEKMKIITDWLDLPSDKRPQLITMYIPQIDMQGHQGGPFGSQVTFTKKAKWAFVYVVFIYFYN